MTQRLQLFARHFSLVLILVTVVSTIILLTLSFFIPASYSDDPLPDEVVKQAAKQGYERTDRDVEIQKLEKAQKDNSLTKEGADRLKELKDANKRYDDALDPKKNPFPPSKEFTEVMERARKARAYQYVIEAFKKMEGRAMEVGMYEKLLEDLMKGPPKLPPFPSLLAAAMPDAGLLPPGTELASSGTLDATSQLVSYIGTIKGTAKLTTGQVIPKGKVFVSGIMYQPWENPDSFVGQGLGDRQKGAGWLPTDALSPPYSIVGMDGSFKYDVPITYYSNKPTDYKIAIGLRYDFSAATIPAKKITDSVNILIDDRPSNLIGLTPNSNPWALGKGFTERTNIPVDSWTAWENPIKKMGPILEWRASPQNFSQFSTMFGNNIIYTEPNYGVRIAPAPGLSPAGWPKTETRPIPTFRLQLSLVQE
jgi:hypothetical protein